MRYTVALEACGAQPTAQVGGKALGLGRLLEAGFHVPPGFVVTTDAYRAFFAANTDLRRMAASVVDTGDSMDLRARVAALRARLEARPLPDDVKSEVIHVCRARRVGAVAVRSSATMEDASDASFAGQQETYLGIVGEAAIVQSIARCWSSLFTPQAVAYRRTRSIDVADVAMAVVVQTMVPADAAGVMLTIDPVSGDRSQVSIEASYGLGASVVNGEVDPDHFAVDKVTLELRSRTVGRKSIHYRLDASNGSVAKLSVPDAEQSRPSLRDDEALELARLGKRAEAAFGQAQDIEWAVVRGRAKEPEFVLLQCRPETAWSRRKRGSEAAPSTPILERMVRSLTGPGRSSPRTKG